MVVTVKEVARFIELTPEHEATIDALLVAIKAKYDPLPELLARILSIYPESQLQNPTTSNPERLYAYMFLVSREWSVEKAMVMIGEVTTYRKANNLDLFRMLPAAFSVRGYDQTAINEFLGSQPRVQPSRYDKVCSGVTQAFTCGIHYWDKQGLPLVYMMFGSADERLLVKKLQQLATVGQKPDDVLWEFVQHTMGTAEEVGLYQQWRADSGELAKDGTDAGAGHIRSSTIVADVKGLSISMLYRPALDIFKACMSRVFRYYPDCVNRIMVVNCPPMIMFAWSIIKGVIDEGVQRKVTFHNVKETPEVLAQVIDRRYIPKHLGGECECEGFCIAHHDPANPMAHVTITEADEVADVLTEDIHIKAGKRHEKHFVLKAGETVYWDFATANSKDINYTVYFIPATEALSKVTKFRTAELEPFPVSREKPGSSCDSFVATKGGTVVLVWDNKHAWIHSKTVQMRVYIEGTDGVYNTDERLVASTSSGNYVPSAEALCPDRPVGRGTSAEAAHGSFNSSTAGTHSHTPTEGRAVRKHKERPAEAEKTHHPH